MLRKNLVVFLISGIALGSFLGCARTGTKTTQPRAKSTAGASVYFVEPANGATVSSPVTVRFGIEGITLAPAGQVTDNAGHHHLLVDVDTLPPLNQPLPFSNNVLHFGQAQTETSVNLAPGPHTLQLILAGGNHIPHDPPVISEKISITVQ